MIICNARLGLDNVESTYLMPPKEILTSEKEIRCVKFALPNKPAWAD